MRLRADERDVSLGIEAAHLKRCVAAGQAPANDNDVRCVACHGAIRAPADRSEYLRRSVERILMSRASR
jgi:hypothetical protein